MTLPATTPPPLTALPTHRRVAASNIVCSWRIVDSPSTFALAIRNDSAYKVEKIQYGAIGGGATVTPEGVRHLNGIAGRMTFEPHDDGALLDARMTLACPGAPAVVRARRVRILETLIEWAQQRKTERIELDVRREFKEELVDDNPGILSLAELGTIQTRLVGWKCGGARKSRRGDEGIVTTPFYYCHEAIFQDPSVLEKLLADPLKRVRRVSPAELATTGGGQHEGQTDDGHVLFSNMFDSTAIHPL